MKKAVKSHAKMQHLLNAAETRVEVQNEVSITHKLRS